MGYAHTTPDRIDRCGSYCLQWREPAAKPNGIPETVSLLRSRHSRLRIAVLVAAALGIGTWSIAPAPADAAGVIGDGIPGLYAQYPYYPYPPGYYPYYPPPAPTYSP